MNDELFDWDDANVARGLRYQTYLKMIIHEALRKVEEDRNSPAA